MTQDRVINSGARLIWGLIVLLACLQAAAFALLGLTVPWQDLLVVGLGSGALLAASFVYARMRPEERLARLSRAAVELFLLSYLCGGLSYAAASVGRPLWDDTLMAWDQSLGFDWLAWVAFVDARPVFAQILTLAYATLLPQIVLVMVALVTAQRYRALDTFLVAYGLAALATVAIATLMPALSPIAILDLDPTAYPNTDLAEATDIAHRIMALRTGDHGLVALSGAQGLIAFPSFHTAGALLLAAAWWHVPILRWPGIALNAVMLASVLSVGTHYLVDLLGGLAVALGTWVLARVLLGSSRVTDRSRPTRIDSSPSQGAGARPPEVLRPCGRS